MNITEPIITIVVPVRNRPDQVIRALDSIAAQSYRNFKLIIVDNGSDDDVTLSKLQQWISDNANSSFSITLLNENKPGASAARNSGLKQVDTPYVLFFDSDDVMLPQHLTRISELLEKFPDTDIAHWDIGIMDSDGWLQVKSPRFHDNLQLHLLHSSLGTQRFAIKSELIRQCGGWDENLPVWNDLELGTRLLIPEQHPIIRRIYGEPTVIVYPQSDSITGDNYHSRAESHHRALDKIALNITNLNDTLYTHTLHAKMAIMAGLYRREGDKTEAKRMLRRALEGINFHPRLVLKTIYQCVRLFGRGGASIALAFFGKKAPKC